ncbi:MAG: hypothetical protein LBU40_03895, partial [Methanobrevibacter sp.]|nr:hypothetical protein [Methanobrevibacter sp.]
MAGKKVTGRIELDISDVEKDSKKAGRLVDDLKKKFTTQSKLDLFNSNKTVADLEKVNATIAKTKELINFKPTASMFSNEIKDAQRFLQILSEARTMMRGIGGFGGGGTVTLGSTSGMGNYLSQINNVNKALDQLRIKQAQLNTSLGGAGFAKFFGQASTQSERTRLSFQNLEAQLKKIKVTGSGKLLALEDEITSVSHLNKELEMTSLLLKGVRQQTMFLQISGNSSLRQQINEAQSHLTSGIGGVGGTTDLSRTQLMTQSALLNNRATLIKDLDKQTNVLNNQGKVIQSTDLKWRGLFNTMSTGGRVARLAIDHLAMMGIQTFVTAVNDAQTALNDYTNASKIYSKDMGWSTSQTSAFTAQLEKLQGTYTKINMYDVGTEVMRMAQMYKLSNKEATNFIETSAIFTSAMKAEGRTTRDSMLALKDFIDQGAGWARRMQEIGVTEENLKATGLWSGDTNDKKGLIASLGAVMKDRQLDVMAKQIYTLGEASDALKISLGQLVGALIVPLTPSLISVFMGLTGFLREIMNIVKGMPDWVITGGIFAIIGGIGGLTVLQNAAKIVQSVKTVTESINTIKNLGFASKLTGLFGGGKGSGSKEVQSTLDNFIPIPPSTKGL